MEECSQKPKEGFIYLTVLQKPLKRRHVAAVAVIVSDNVFFPIGAFANRFRTMTENHLEIEDKGGTEHGLVASRFREEAELDPHIHGSCGTFETGFSLCAQE
jgi:hypothetical protein